MRLASIDPLNQRQSSAVLAPPSPSTQRCACEHMCHILCPVVYCVLALVEGWVGHRYFQFRGGFRDKQCGATSSPPRAQAKRPPSATHDSMMCVSGRNRMAGVGWKDWGSESGEGKREGEIGSGVSRLCSKPRTSVRSYPFRVGSACVHVSLECNLNLIAKTSFLPQFPLASCPLPTMPLACAPSRTLTWFPLPSPSLPRPPRLEHEQGC